jgi:hypothetical protein
MLPNTLKTAGSLYAFELKKIDRNGNSAEDYSRKLSKKFPNIYCEYKAPIVES